MKVLGCAFAALGMTSGARDDTFIVRPATAVASIVGRTASAHAGSPGQLRHQMSERDLPHERLAGQVVAAEGA